MRFSPILFNFAFSTAASTAYGSISRQKADFAPHNSEQIASIPLPHPASRSVVSGLIYFLRDKRQSFVVSCVPVPKAEPGSICMIMSFSEASSGISSHVGFMIISSATLNALKLSFHLSFH